MSINVLRIDASARRDGSVTRALTDTITAEFAAEFADASLTHRDLAQSLPHIDDTWVAANFTPADARTPAQSDHLALSDTLVAELFAADVIVIGVPIYNFSIPAALKAWIDLIARAGLTFRYTEAGPVGLLGGKRVIIAAASGGVPIGSAADFATSYLLHVLGFVGLTDIEIRQQSDYADDALVA